MSSNRDLYSIDADEQILRHVKRHPIGLAPIWLSGIMVFIGLGLAVAGVTFLGGDFGINLPISVVAIVSLVVALLVLLVTYIGTVVYFRNELVVTDQAVIEIDQRSLFSRNVSQMSLANIQEITIQQNGIFAHMFKYGIITFETPGEQANFEFKFTPNPHELSKVIQEASERFIELHPDAGFGNRSPVSLNQNSVNPPPVPKG